MKSERKEGGEKTERPQSVAPFLNGIENEERRRDAKTLLKWMKELTGLKPQLWNHSIVGFGRYRYRYESGREGEHFRIGFSPRASGMSLYLMSEFDGEAELMKRVGKHSMGRCCMRFKRLADLDAEVLRELIEKSARGKICSEAED